MDGIVSTAPPILSQQHPTGTQKVFSACQMVPIKMTCEETRNSKKQASRHMFPGALLVSKGIRTLCRVSGGSDTSKDREWAKRANETNGQEHRLLGFGAGKTRLRSIFFYFSFSCLVERKQTNYENTKSRKECWDAFLRLLVIFLFVFAIYICPESSIFRWLRNPQTSLMPKNRILQGHPGVPEKAASPIPSFKVSQTMVRVRRTSQFRKKER